MDGSDRIPMSAAPGDATRLSERLVQENQHYWLHLEAKSPLEKYPAKQHARRVQETLGVRKGLVYLAGQPSRNNEDSDMPAPWRQRRYFYYLSGVDEPNCHVTYDIQNDVLSLFLPQIDPKRVIWNGRGSTPAEALDKYDIDQVFYVDQMDDFVYEWMKFNRGDLYILHPSQSPQYNGLYGNIDSESLQPAMNRARIIKDDHEIQMIRKANDISSTAHKQVLANILRFKNEAQVEGLFLDACISRQAKQQAYDPIAASGINAGTLHYDANNEDFDDRQLMCLDAGCEWNLYASDITRTFPLSGSWPSEEAKNIYLLVQKMQETCISQLRPGVRYLDIHILAHQIAIDGLLKLGILHNGTKEEIFKAGTSRAFFPHGLGHHVGLEVHDVGQGELMSAKKGYSRYENVPSLYPENFHQPVYDNALCLAPTDPHSPHLEEGMVVTVEPGIYFSVYALNMFYLPSPIHSKFINVEVLKKYLPVGGVRIEDDIRITSKSYENLTTAPKGEEMLEIIRSQNVLSSRLPRIPNFGFKKEEKEEVLLRAPGISRGTPEPILKAISRAGTMPVERKDRKSVDFEPFEGPSLYSGFKRASTIDFPPPISRSSQVPTFLQNAAKPLCGKLTQGFHHSYLRVGGESTGAIPPVWPFSRDQATKLCPKCSILMQTLNRLGEKLEGQDMPAEPESKPTPVPSGNDSGNLKAVPSPSKRYQEIKKESVSDHRVGNTRVSKQHAQKERDMLQHEQERLESLQERLRLARARYELDEREIERPLHKQISSELSGVKSSSNRHEIVGKLANMKLEELPKTDGLCLNDHPQPALSPFKSTPVSHATQTEMQHIENKLQTRQEPPLNPREGPLTARRPVGWVPTEPRTKPARSRASFEGLGGTRGEPKQARDYRSAPPMPLPVHPAPRPQSRWSNTLNSPAHDLPHDYHNTFPNRPPLTSHGTSLSNDMYNRHNSTRSSMDEESAAKLEKFDRLRRDIDKYFEHVRLGDK